MPSIFSKIISGEISSYKIGENVFCYAFLDINPLVRGHTLVVPKTEVDYLFDLPEPFYTELFKFSKIISSAIQKAIPCERVGITVIGTEVPHAHVHLIPFNQMSQMNFSNPKLFLSDDEFLEISKKISSFIS